MNNDQLQNGDKYTLEKVSVCYGQVVRSRFKLFIGFIDAALIDSKTIFHVGLKIPTFINLPQN